MKKIEFFSFFERTNEFDEALNKLIKSHDRIKRTQILSDENVMRYRHGLKWITVSSDASEEASEMSRHQAEITIMFDDIINHKLSAIPKFVEDISMRMHAAVQKMLYQTISDSCDKSGRTINAKEQPDPAEAVLAALRSVEFGVDRWGSVTKPALHLDPKSFEALKKATAEKGSYFENEVDKITQEKSKAALEREQLRLSKFKQLL